MSVSAVAEVPAAEMPALVTDAEQTTERPAIIITGTRSERTTASEPYAIRVLDTEQLERTLPRTVPEALRQLPGVLVQKTASGHGSPYIRGFTGNRTLLVVDGIRYNNATFRDGANEYFAQIDSFALAQIELISGPSSALYGAEAVGGVINLVTRSTGMREEEGRFANAAQVMRVSSGDGSVVSRNSFGVGEGDQWGFRGGATIREYGDVRAARSGRLPFTGYSERAFDTRLEIAVGPDWTANVAHQRLWQDDVPRTHSTIFSVPFAGTVQGTDLVREKDHERGLTYAKLRGRGRSAWLSAVEVTLSHQSRLEEELRVRGDGVEIDQGFTSDLFGLSAVFDTELGAMAFTYGFDLSREKIDSFRNDTDPQTGAITTRLQGPVGTNARYDQAGGFVRAIAEMGGEFSLEASLRASWIAADVGQFADPVSGAAIAFADSWSDLSGSFRVLYSGGTHRLWAGYSRSFRAPNIADISRFGRSRSNEIEVASLNLSEEQFDTLELGYRFAQSGLNLGFNVYTTFLRDYIATVPTGQTRDGLIEVAKRNAASGRVSGVELSVETSLGSGFGLNGNATWLRGRLTSPLANGPLTEPLSRVQPLSGNLSLDWERRDSWARLELSLFARADQLSAGDRADVERIPPGGTPGYGLVNFRAGTRLARSIRVTAEFNNIFNQAYRSHGSGSNEPGRHIALSISLEI